MAESQNPAIPATFKFQHRYSGLWRKNPQYRPVITISVSPKFAMYIRYSAAMADI